MRTRSIWLALLLLPACTYSAAVKRGDAALAAQDFDKARLAYEFAYDTKAKDAAQQGLERATAGWVAAKLTEAGTASSGGDHEGADRLLREVALLQPEAEGLSDARVKAQGNLVAALRGQMDKLDEDVSGTYGFAVLAKRIYPGIPETNDAVQTVRDRVEADAKALLEAKDFADARKMAALIKEVEPGYASRSDALVDEITEAWADDLVAQATKAERSEPGLSAVLYARAFELRERPEDLESSRAAWDSAAAEGLLSVFVEHGGTGARPIRLRKAVAAAAEESQGVKRGYSSGWTLKAKVFAPETRCRETQEKEALTKDYISGQIEVPNPEHVAQAAVTESASDVLDAAQAKVDDIQPRAEAANEELARIEKELSAQTAEVTATTSLLAQTKGQHESSIAEVAKVEAELAALPAEAERSKATIAEKLETVKGYVAEWEERVGRDTTALAEFQAAVESLNGELATAKPKAESLNTELEAAVQALTAAEKTHSDARATLSNLSPTMMEDVPDTLKYDKTTWTQTCTGRSSVYFVARWDNELESPVKFEVVKTATDTSQKGHAKAEVVEDPKQYPKSERELTAELEAETEEKVNAAVEAYVADYFSSSVGRAFEEADTHTLISILAATRERMSADSRAKIAAYLTEQHGLEKFEILDPREPVAAAAPEAAPAEGEAAEGEETAATEGEAAETAETPAVSKPDAEAKPEAEASPEADGKPVWK